jgi:hypothetical protein
MLTLQGEVCYMELQILMWHVKQRVNKGKMRLLTSEVGSIQIYITVFDLDILTMAMRRNM